MEIIAFIILTIIFSQLFPCCDSESVSGKIFAVVSLVGTVVGCIAIVFYTYLRIVIY